MPTTEYHDTKNPVLRYGVAAPFLWLMLIPLVFSDILVEIYHRICFPLYGIPLVKRSQYIRILDRTKLPYLSLGEKIGCAYCAYINGWLHYASVIAGRTETYFCAITHLEERGYIASEHEKSFAKYGDEMALRKRYAAHEAKHGNDTN